MHICRYYVTPFLVIGRAVTLPILNILESISANLCCRVVNSPEVHAKKVDHVKKQVRKICLTISSFITLSVTNFIDFGLECKWEEDKIMHSEIRVEIHVVENPYL